MAFKSGENQNQRRNENTVRQNKARSGFFDTNRQISEFEFPPVTTSSHTQINTTNPSTVMSTTSASGYKFVTTLPSSQPKQAHNTISTTVAGVMPGQSNDRIEDIHAMVAHLIRKSDEADQMKVKVSSNTDRLDRIEAKIGKPEEIAAPLSLAIRNLPLPGHGEDDLQIVKALLFEINAKDVNPDQDIVKVVRQGATGENPGTVMVELISDEVRAAIMKTKKILEQHPNPCLRRVIVKNMKSKQELKMDIAMNEMLRKLPGGENLYIANNGHIREKTAQQISFQNSFRGRVPSERFFQPRTQAPAPPPRQPTVPQPIFETHPMALARYPVQQAVHPYTNQVPSFRHNFPHQSQPSVREAYLPGPMFTQTTHDPTFRYAIQQQPNVPLPVPPVSDAAPAPWLSASFPPPSINQPVTIPLTTVNSVANTEPAMMPSLSCQVDHPVNTTLAIDGKQNCQVDTVSQAGTPLHPAAVGHQPQEQLQQHQEQQQEVSGDTISDL